MFYRERGLIAYEQTAWNVNVCYFMVFVGFGVIIPIVPEVIRATGASTVNLGILMASYSIASFITAPFGEAFRYKRPPSHLTLGLTWL